MQEVGSPLRLWALSQEAHSSDNAYYTSHSKTTLPFAIMLGGLITLNLYSQKKALWSLSHCQLQSFGENFLFICIITNIPKARSQPKGASSGAPQPSSFRFSPSSGRLQNMPALLMLAYSTNRGDVGTTKGTASGAPGSW